MNPQNETKDGNFCYIQTEYGLLKKAWLTDSKGNEIITVEVSNYCRTKDTIPDLDYDIT